MRHTSKLNDRRAGPGVTLDGPGTRRPELEDVRLQASRAPTSVALTAAPLSYYHVPESNQSLYHPPGHIGLLGQRHGKGPLPNAWGIVCRPRLAALAPQ